MPSFFFFFKDLSVHSLWLILFFWKAGHFPHFLFVTSVPGVDQEGK